MAIRQVLLNGAGASGDGTTWNDDSSGTAAYIGYNGLEAAVLASAPGDIVYVKGVDTASDGVGITTGLNTAAYITNPVMARGCKSTTTNNQGAIVQSDLIPGQRTGAAPGIFAQNDPDVPTLTLTGNSAGSFRCDGSVYWYGIKIQADYFIAFSSDTLLNNWQGLIELEECHLEITAPNLGMLLQYSDAGSVLRLKNTDLVCVANADIKPALKGGQVIMEAGSISKVNRSFFVGESTGRPLSGGLHVRGTKCFGGASSIIDTSLVGAADVSLERCEFPPAYSLTVGSREADFNIENFGSDSDTSGIVTSERNYQRRSIFGDLDLETVAVRTGPTDDEAGDGPYSYAITPIAGSTLPGVRGMALRIHPIWLTAGPQTLEFYFASDNGNARVTDWDDDAVWLIGETVNESGASISERISTQLDILGAPVALPSDAISSWAAPAVRPQKLVVSVDPAYEGTFTGEIFFAPGTADLIYFDPLGAVV